MAFRRKNNKAGNLDISDVTGRREMEERERKRKQAGSAVSVWEQLPSGVVVEFNQFLTTD